MSMTIAARVSERTVGPVRSRAIEEVQKLLDAAFAVLRRGGLDGLTVAEVLAEAGLSTRAFYRHFASKDELVLALFAHESERATHRRAARLASLDSPLEALGAWIDDVLALGFEPRRAARTRVLLAEGGRLRRDFPQEFGAVLDGELEPLVAILDRGREQGVFPNCDAAADARTIHALVWSFAEARLDGQPLTAEVARAHIDRYVLPALGVPDDLR